MRYLQGQFSLLDKSWQKGYSQEVKRSAIAFLILTGLFFALCLAIPSLRTMLVEQVYGLVSGMDVTDESGALSVGGLFVNNLEACLMIMLYGLIPYVHLPALAMGLNAMLLGVLGAQMVASGQSLTLYFLAILPHGIFESPALVLSFAMGLYLCGQLTNRVRGREGALSFWDCMEQISALCISVVIPLLAVAATVEAYVTPTLVGLFS